jgi:hypothetical protein
MIAQRVEASPLHFLLRPEKFWMRQRTVAALRLLAGRSMIENHFKMQSETWNEI